jgi:hypothetical protein
MVKFPVNKVHKIPISVLIEDRILLRCFSINECNLMYNNLIFIYFDKTLNSVKNKYVIFKTENDK